MPYIDPAVIAKAKEMDLLTYLQSYEPHELVRIGSTTYCTRTHDSLKISNGKWHWHSRGIGGRSALDYLIKVRGLQFKAAVGQIMGWAAIQPPVSAPQKKVEMNAFALPPKNLTSNRMMDYLQGRGIAIAIIKYCCDRGLLYESAPYGNAVFVGRDEMDAPRYAALRGERFMGEVAGSSKRYSFGISSVKPCDTVNLFESPIDLLSYATLLRLKRRNPWRDNLLSLSGVSKSSKALPAALEQFLENHPDTRNVVCRFDNDAVGHDAAGAIRMELEGRCLVYSEPPPSGKDYNEYLCGRLDRQQKTRKKEYAR